MSCFIVVWNLVIIAAERYLAVCQPFKHNEFTKRKIVLCYVLIYFCAIIFNFTTAFDVSYIQSDLNFSVKSSSVWGFWSQMSFSLSFLSQITFSLSFLWVKSHSVWASPESNHFQSELPLSQITFSLSFLWNKSHSVWVSSESNYIQSEHPFRQFTLGMNLFSQWK